MVIWLPYLTIQAVKITGIIPSRIPVSYTHLDVYKRQILDNLERVTSKLLLAFLTRGFMPLRGFTANFFKHSTTELTTWQGLGKVVAALSK